MNARGAVHFIDLPSDEPTLKRTLSTCQLDRRQKRQVQAVAAERSGTRYLQNHFSWTEAAGALHFRAAIVSKPMTRPQGPRVMLATNYLDQVSRPRVRPGENYAALS